MKVDIHTMIHTDTVTDMLPEQIKELVCLIGLTATMTLVDKFGGLSFGMPHSTNTKNGKWLVRELGADIANVLIDRHKGEKLYINNCDALRVYLRNRALVGAIIACMETGTSQHRAVQETAPVFGITERRAYDILKEMTNGKTQLNLF
ncbi:hypothetical protein [Moraxella lacunata]|nr:hypothetical protein [Moraxella lacunata]MDI4507267.1 hypothetical protein [Moraxella lacunata]